MANKTKRQNVDKLVRDTVADFLNENPDYSGSKLKKLVESQLRARGFRYDFTVRTYENIKNKSGELRQQLDKYWSMGADRDYPISPYSLDAVISIQDLLLENGKRLTIRRALRIGALNPILSATLEKTYPMGHEIERDLVLLQVASFYTRMEQIAERFDDKNQYIDTLELDKKFLIKKDISFETVLKEWMNIFLPTPDEKQQGQAGLFINEEQDSFIGILRMSGSIGEKYKAILLLVNGDPPKKVEGHPGLKIGILKTMAISTRKEIEEAIRSEKISEKQGETK